jgi:hydrogenase maturation protease
MNPFRVLQTVASLGGRCARVLLVGCEPTPPAEDAPADDVPMEMTPPVRAAVDEAVRLVESLVERLNRSEDLALNNLAPPGGPPSPATYQETQL